MQDSSLIPNAIEELLRYESPSPVQGRWLTQDVELHGRLIPARSKGAVAHRLCRAGRTCLPRVGSSSIFVVTSDSTLRSDTHSSNFIVYLAQRIADIQEIEIIIVGRSKHYLSLCGEHLSVDNMNKAIEMVSENMNISIKEFTVAGESDNNRFRHHWYIFTDKDVDKQVLKNKLNFYLKELNDDYRVERGHMLYDITVDVLPNNVFINWLQNEGKEGAQIKFPRVLKNKQNSKTFEPACSSRTNIVKGLGSSS